MGHIIHSDRTNSRGVASPIDTTGLARSSAAVLVPWLAADKLKASGSDGSALADVAGPADVAGSADVAVPGELLEAAALDTFLRAFLAALAVAADCRTVSSSCAQVNPILS